MQINLSPGGSQVQAPIRLLDIPRMEVPRGPDAKDPQQRLTGELGPGTRAPRLVGRSTGATSTRRESVASRC